LIRRLLDDSWLEGLHVLEMFWNLNRANCVVTEGMSAGGASSIMICRPCCVGCPHDPPTTWLHVAEQRPFTARLDRIDLRRRGVCAASEQSPAAPDQGRVRAAVESDRGRDD